MNATSVPEIGRCMCGATVLGDSFRDRESYLEFLRTGRALCQDCQDAIFLAGNPDDPDHPFPIVDGALAAVRGAPGVLEETCFLPFRVVPAPWTRIAFEARFIVRAGPALEPLDQWDELEPMREPLAEHQVRVREHRSVEVAELAGQLDRLAFLVAADRTSLDAVRSAYPLLSRIAAASLEDDVPWQAAFARPLRPLESWWWPEHDTSSALRECALMGYVLLERDGAGRRVLDHLAASHEALVNHPGLRPT